MLENEKLVLVHFFSDMKNLCGKNDLLSDLEQYHIAKESFSVSFNMYRLDLIDDKIRISSHYTGEDVLLDYKAFTESITV